MTDEEIRQRLLLAIAAAWQEGCPIAFPQGSEQLAAIALRRWRSGHRRFRKQPPTRVQRIADLAEGLIQACETDPRLVGPLRIDYIYLAGSLANVFEAATDKEHTE